MTLRKGFGVCVSVVNEHISELITANIVASTTSIKKILKMLLVKKSVRLLLNF